MARADRRRASRAKPTPGIRARGQTAVVEDTLFFSRLRRRAKWVFVLLAASFGIGFVAFGVGSDVPGGVADILQGRSPSSGPSIEEAREKVEQNPRDPAALRELATALVDDGRPAEAIDPLERYSRLEPQDVDALRELAGLHLTVANRLRAEAQVLQLQIQEADPASQFQPTGELGDALGNPPISNAVTGSIQDDLNAKLLALQAQYQAVLEVYERVVVLRPEDALLQLDLGDAAVQAGDTETAIAAYERFLELAPDDPQAPVVQQQIDQLKGDNG